MTADARTPAPEAEVWLSVQDASAMLGVSPATLRRWSAAGEVDAFTTPGGHRRFALSTLRALLPYAGEGLGRQTTARSHERLLRVIHRHARGEARSSGWVRRLDPATAERFRQRGRDLTGCLLDYLDAEGPARRRTALSSMEAAATDLGRLVAASGCGLVEAVGVFLRLRAQLIAELSATAVRAGLATADAMVLVARGGEVVDRMLKAFVAGYSDTGRVVPNACV